MFFKAAQPFFRSAVRPSELRERKLARKWLQFATLVFALVRARLLFTAAAIADTPAVGAAAVAALPAVADVDVAVGVALV